MPSKPGIIFIINVLFVCLVVYTSQACTAFSIKKGNTIFYGENFDWHAKDGLVVINKRGVKKIPQVFGAGDQKTASWISKYGSVTFNTLGKEYFHGGINSKGLFVTGLTLEHSQYPPKDSRPVVSHAQYKQYFLDNCATVDEVMRETSNIRIFARNQKYPIHIFVADNTGQCAVIEFIDGKMVYHKGDEMTINVLSNSVYADAVDYLKEHKGFGGDKIVKKNRSNSLDRFVKASAMVQSYHSNPSEPSKEYGFNILKSVAQGERTVWRIVYDLNLMRIYFRTLLNEKLQYIDMKSIDFSCDSPSLVLDLKNRYSGDLTRHFKEFTPAVNREFIMRMTQFYTLPEKILDALVSYEYGMTCAQ